MTKLAIDPILPEQLRGVPSDEAANPLLRFNAKVQQLATVEA
jgi:hypothetical protein